MILTPDEELLIEAYDICSRTELIQEINKSIQYIDDTDMSELIAGLLEKLERMSDEQFQEILPEK